MKVNGSKGKAHSHRIRMRRRTQEGGRKKAHQAAYVHGEQGATCAARVRRREQGTGQEEAEWCDAREEHE